VPKPKAILLISAHWYGPGLAVTADEHPKTIHDFGGFDPEFYEIQYPSPGSPCLAGRVKDILASEKVQMTTDEWGLDHGAWTTLMHIYPKADVPVV